MSLTEIAALLGLNLALIIAVMTGLWLVSLKVRDVSFIDAVWPMAMLFLALVTFPRTEGDPTRKWLLMWLVGIWALRLGWHLYRRWRAHGADGRYLNLLARMETNRGWGFGKTALLAVFLRRLRLVGAVSDRGRDRPRDMGDRGAAVPDLHPDQMVGDRHHREGHSRDPAGLCRLCAADQRLHSLAAEEGLRRFSATENPRRLRDEGLTVLISPGVMSPRL
jgi:hypothetical protein